MNPKIAVYSVVIELPLSAKLWGISLGFRKAIADTKAAQTVSLAGIADTVVFR